MEYFEDFVELVPAGRLKINCFKILLNYLKREYEYDLDGWFPDFIKDFENLLLFLEGIEEHADQSKLLKQIKLSGEK